MVASSVQKKNQLGETFSERARNCRAVCEFSMAMGISWDEARDYFVELLREQESEQAEGAK